MDVFPDVDKMLAVIDQWQKPLEGRGQEESIIRDGYATTSNNEVQTLKLTRWIDLPKSALLPTSHP